ncbi:hypothetical protein [Burkholderia sp. Tr-20390]|uniref:hypothetical protein n=1 Tax=Burkholderia sp. Tr-20390 TaxID=2703904 RepID=UPI00198126D2|nr:hypothetical protein [Burkholderia sp. Tr-20390]MBN3729387.1 hypothetical protein [Burkholderia sp. Tr-20390]
MATSRGFDDWAAEVARAFVGLGVPLLEAKHIPYDNEEWFRREFDAGESAAMTAQDWVNNS